VGVNAEEGSSPHHPVSLLQLNESVDLIFLMDRAKRRPEPLTEFADRNNKFRALPSYSGQSACVSCQSRAERPGTPLPPRRTRPTHDANTVLIYAVWRRGLT
jgi:hypothetical protein